MGEIPYTMKIVMSLDLHWVYLVMDFAYELSKFTAKSWVQAIAKIGNQARC